MFLVHDICKMPDESFNDSGRILQNYARERTWLVEAYWLHMTVHLSPNELERYFLE